jgi:signal transduction histidine kinase
MNPGPVARIERDGTILLGNRVTRQLFGEDVLLGKNWLDVCPGMSPELWRRILDAQRPMPIEVHFDHSTFQFTYVHPEARDQVFVYGADITPQKEIEKKLEEQRAIVSEIARFPDMNPGPVLRMDLNGTILLSNAAATQTFGEDLLNRSWKAVCPGLTEKKWEEILSKDEVVPFEACVGSKDFVFHHRMDSKTQLVFVYGTDITIQKQTEKKLEEQRAIVAEIARFPDMNPGPVLRMDPEATILLSNAAATNVFGEDLLDRCWKDVCPGMTQKVWDRILISEEVVPVETRVGGRDYVFSHRRDFKTDLVFAFGADVTLQKAAERGLRQSEKMATLGTLAAGVAHELNNPAAATRRAALQLREAFTALEKAHTQLNTIVLTAEERTMMTSLALKVDAASKSQNQLDALTRSDREAEIEDWLDDKGVEDTWNIAPVLVAIGLTASELEEFVSKMSSEALEAITPWLASLHPVYSLLYEIAEGSSRISEIVVALKNYSYLGQAPIQQVNIHEGLDNTLVILRNKLKLGINVHREYGSDVPPIVAYGSELNQVWTNLLDNAADAMQGKGEITIRTRREGKWAVVEIEDNGPGIPADIQSRIFDPFFTTKAPGKGTGLGLSTSYGIVTEKHKGTIEVRSKPGKTTFIVRLPVEAS